MHLQEEVKKLASTVETLVIKVAKVSEKPSITPSIDPCYLYARVVCQKLKDRLGKSSLEEALLCKVINYTVISDLPSMKVKIDKKDLFRALSANKKLLKVRLWENTSSISSGNPATFPNSGNIPVDRTTRNINNFTISTWNCRGLDGRGPYLSQLANDGSDVIVVTEHWLWPYESHRLSQVLPGFDAECCCDARLSEVSTLTSGCGGVGLLYRKGLKITPILNIASDRICGIRVEFPSASHARVIYTIYTGSISSVYGQGYRML